MRSQGRAFPTRARSWASSSTTRYRSAHNLVASSTRGKREAVLRVMRQQMSDPLRVFATVRLWGVAL